MQTLSGAHRFKFLCVTFGVLFAVTTLANCSILSATPAPTARPAPTPDTSNEGQSAPSSRQTGAPIIAPQPTSSDDDSVSSDTFTPAAPNNQGKIPTGMSRIAGRVTDPDGNPIQGARVTVPKGTTAVPERAVLTNANGEYQWTLRPGTYTIQVNADAYKVASAEVTTQVDKQSQLDFKLERE